MSSLKGILRRSGMLVLLIVALFVGSVVTIHTLNITPAHAAAAVGSIQDPNIKYIGRWDKTSSTTMYKSYWPATYLRTSFTGKTVKIKLAVPVNIYVSVDGGAIILYAGAKGTFNLTPTPLASGNQSIRARRVSRHIEF